MSNDNPGAPQHEVPAADGLGDTTPTVEVEAVADGTPTLLEDGGPAVSFGELLSAATAANPQAAAGYWLGRAFDAIGQLPDCGERQLATAFVVQAGRQLTAYTERLEAEAKAAAAEAREADDVAVAEGTAPQRVSGHARAARRRLARKGRQVEHRGRVTVVVPDTDTEEVSA